MAIQEVMLRLPLENFRQIQRAAEQRHRLVDDVLVEAVIAAAPASGAPSTEVQSALAQMTYLNDAALWQADRATMDPNQRERLEYLHDQQQRALLTDEERSQEQSLLELYRGTVLVRAHAALLLKQRGYDISDLTQFVPLE